MIYFDKVVVLVYRFFNELSVSISENFFGRKVIVGFVMKMVEYDIGIVIFIGIGNINLIYVFVIVLIFLIELFERLKVLLIYKINYYIIFFLYLINKYNIIL